MYRSSSAGQFENKGFSPELFEAAHEYALVVSEQKITYPMNPEEVDKFNCALNQFVSRCVEAADSDTGEVDQELRWVGVARQVLKECGRDNPKLKGFERIRIFGSKCEDQQRQLYKEAIS